MVQSRGEDAVLTSLFDAEWPRAKHRVLRNSTMAAWEEAGSPAPGRRPGEWEQVATARGTLRLLKGPKAVKKLSTPRVGIHEVPSTGGRVVWRIAKKPPPYQ